MFRNRCHQKEHTSGCNKDTFQQKHDTNDFKGFEVSLDILMQLILIMSPRQSKNIFVSSDTQSNNTGSKVGFEKELIKIKKFLKMFVGMGSS